ncbi:MAG: cache domain-containing protein [Cocleimonas sp.]
MKIFHSIFAIFLLIAALFWVQQSITSARQEAINQASERLKLTRDIRIAQLNSEIKTIYSEIRFWADSKPLQQGMIKMLSAWDELGSDPKAKARQLYITDNPLFPNYAADYSNANDGSSYSETHEELHKLLKGLIKRRGYYDVFLIANNGDIVYTVYKEDDYATNLLRGKYKGTSLAQGFKEVQDDTDLNHISLFDFIAYEPSNNAPSSFIQASIVNEKNRTQGVLAFQLPTEPIDEIVSGVSSASGEVAILAVGSDYLLRNRINKEVIKEQVRSIAIDKALKGESGVEQLNDYKGNKTITAYAPFDFSYNILGKTAKNSWAIIVKQDLDEVLAPVEAETKKQLLLLAGLTLVSLLFAWLLTRKEEELSTTE